MNQTEAATFEKEKNRKAFLYTAIICGLILLIFFIIKWPVNAAAPPVVTELMEINLGNDDEGFGEEQPLIKGNRTPAEPNNEPATNRSSPSNEDDNIDPVDNNDANAAPVTRTTKTKTNAKVITPTETPVEKPKKPRFAYDGPNTGKPGNNPNEDNGYRYQGNDPNGKGDKGSPDGNKDSYGNTPGGKIGGPRIVKGNRKIVRYYSFTGDLAKATIFAVIKVAPNGQGSFIRIVKPSTSFNQSYATAISNYLRNIQFDKSDEESNVTVQFNFSVN